MNTIAKNSLTSITAAFLSLLLHDIGRADAPRELPNQPASSLRPVSGDRLSAIPKGFIPSAGRMPDEEVRFLIRDCGVSAYFTDRGFVLWNGQTTTVSNNGIKSRVPVAPRWSLAGANAVEPVGGATLGHTFSFFRGNDPDKWRANVSAHREITYPGILSGVDMRVESLARGFEYSFQVQPHARPYLNFRYDGISGLELSPAGDLIVRTAAGHFTESRPVSWQIIEGTKRPVLSAFELVSASEYRIALGPYDERHELVVDPVLDWSTFIGGSYFDNGRTVRVDSDGNVVLAGHCSSIDLPDTAGFSTGPGIDTTYPEAYVAKFTPDGTELLWLGYLGGDAGTQVGWKCMVLTSAGDICVTGFTSASNFPDTTGAPLSGSYDGFVTKIKSDGSALLWSRLLGGANLEEHLAVALDQNENLLVTGVTRSDDFPVTAGVWDTALGGTQDAFVAQLNGSSGAVQWASYLGGSADERVVAIAAAANGDALVLGDTASADFPTVSALDTTLGGANDAFVTRFTANGASLVWSTYLGGSDKEHDLLDAPDSWAKGDVALDSAGNVLVVGQTFSADFPTTPGVFQPARRGNNDGFVTKIAADGSQFLWSSYLGGTGPAEPDGREDIAWAVTVNPWDEVFVGGWTSCTDFPTTSDALKPSQTSAVRYDGFLTKLNPVGSQILYSTYLGGYDNNDVVLGIAYDSGNVFVTGWATAAAFPTTAGAYQTGCESCSTPNLWASDGYVMKFLDAYIAHDGFESGNYSGGAGWVGSWTASGDISIRTNQDGPHSGTRHVRLRSSTGYLQRSVNIPASTTTVQLGFWAKVNSFEGSDRADVLVRSTGANFTTITSLTAAQGDNQYHYYDFDLTSFLPASQITIAFDAAMSASNDYLYLDDIRLTGTSEPVPPVADAGPDQTITDTDSGGFESVTLDGSDSFDPDGGTIVSYEWKEGATIHGTAASINTSLSVGIHTVTLTVTDDEGATATDTVQVTVNAPPPPPSNPLHCGDLDRSSANSGKNWKATVVVTIHDGNHVPVPGATVAIGWSAGGTPTATGTTDANGRCTFISGAISKSIPTVTLTITNVTHAPLTYASAANHDPDGDSDGTNITVAKP